MPTSLEICAGAGGQALGLEQAGFDHVALVEVDAYACRTLRINRPHWNVIQDDIRQFSGRPFRGTDLLAGGVPCPPFSVAGKQLGHDDERDLFPEVLRLVREIQPRAVMIENVRGLMTPTFDRYRDLILARLDLAGYAGEWRLLNASDYGVPQLRPRAVLVAMQLEFWTNFRWPEPKRIPSGTVGEILWEEMASCGWEGADSWAKGARSIAPTLVGGSRKHGGPDLGPTRAREAWRKLGVDGKGLADAPPESGFTGMPRLTVKMAALLQGFPQYWRVIGGKTAAYRQVGNAFPPPVASAIGNQIELALNKPKAVQPEVSHEFSTERSPAGVP
jgi:DNA (cytosine-5)-methyltransferase 1